MSKSDITVLIVGATGLVGRECVRAFASHPAVSRLVTLLRRPLPAELRAPKVAEHVIDFDQLDEHSELFRVSHVLSALGTTIRQAGSRDRFRQVDHDYVVAAARVGLTQGARHLLLVSALGANPSSRIFYNRVKGDAETAVTALGYPSVTIVRPSLLIGDREEFRLGERVGQTVAFLAPPKFKPVHATQVAKTLLRAAVEDRSGVRIIESAEIHKIDERKN